VFALTDTSSEMFLRLRGIGHEIMYKPNIMTLTMLRVMSMQGGLHRNAGRLSREHGILLSLTTAVNGYGTARHLARTTRTKRRIVQVDMMHPNDSDAFRGMFLSVGSLFGGGVSVVIA
jgi:hypothetical protein